MVSVMVSIQVRRMFAEVRRMFSLRDVLSRKVVKRRRVGTSLHLSLDGRSQSEEAKASRPKGVRNSLRLLPQLLVWCRLDAGLSPGRARRVYLASLPP